MKQQVQAVHWLEGDAPLPPTHEALGPNSQAPGLLAAGGQLSEQRLDEAYSRGIFPWFSPGQPVLWWSPDPRMVLPVANFKLSRSLKKTLKRFLLTPGCEIRFDSDFPAVIQACANTPRDGQSGTWIVPQMVVAYMAWHRAGRAHSTEVWVDGQLVGGLYFVNLGRMVFGESMFSRVSDASKLALAALVAACRARGVPLIDCQQNTGHLASLGAHEIKRSAFEVHLMQHVAMPLTPAVPCGAEVAAANAGLASQAAAGRWAAPLHSQVPLCARWTYDAAHWSQLGI